MNKNAHTTTIPDRLFAANVSGLISEPTNSPNSRPQPISAVTLNTPRIAGRVNNNNTFLTIENNETMEDFTNSGSIKVFPNPTSGILTIAIDGAEGINHISINDINGRCVAEMKTGETRVIMDITGMRAGGYLVSVNNGGRLFIEKIILE